MRMSQIECRKRELSFKYHLAFSIVEVAISGQKTLIFQKIYIRFLGNQIALKTKNSHITSIWK